MDDDGGELRGYVDDTSGGRGGSVGKDVAGRVHISLSSVKCVTISGAKWTNFKRIFFKKSTINLHRRGTAIT